MSSPLETPAPPAPASRTGLLEGFLVDADGGAHPILPETLAADPALRPPEGGYVWLHFELDAARLWAPVHMDLDETTQRALFALETRPRFTPHDGQILMNLRGVNLNEGHEPEEMLSLRIHLEPGRLITVRRQRSVAIEAIREDLRSDRAPADPGTLLLRIVSGLNDRIEPVVDALSDRVDGLEELSLRPDAADIRAELSSMRHDALVFRRYIAPQREAVMRFATTESPLLPASERVTAREEADRVTRVVEELDITRERAAVIHEQIAARRADEMNRNMMILSVVSAVFLPLGFVTGLLGINVAGMPGAEWQPAFWIVCAFCAALGGLLGFVFYRLGWLRPG